MEQANFSLSFGYAFIYLGVVASYPLLCDLKKMNIGFWHDRLIVAESVSVYTRSVGARNMQTYRDWKTKIWN